MTHKVDHLSASLLGPALEAEQGGSNSQWDENRQWGLKCVSARVQ